MTREERIAAAHRIAGMAAQLIVDDARRAKLPTSDLGMICAVTIAIVVTAVTKAQDSRMPKALARRLLDTVVQATRHSISERLRVPDAD
jgi:hypothetical protein